MRKATKIMLIAGLLAAVAIGCIFVLFSPERLTPENPKGKTIYYTVVDDDKAQSGENNRYTYTLECVDGKGKKKTVTFSAGKRLKDGAYLMLYEAPLRGVTFWQEVQHSDLPDKVKAAYPAAG
ncbi:YxeA family protein [Paenibacillus ginsengihumi]|uniref:YxeA family protein n=1 Tax=Paenibacillus ginsengihumi TaxID=431596 RepID=UPI000372C904|nr:YxeA family protein [Paenibacillus ginsengihumi]